MNMPLNCPKGGSILQFIRRDVLYLSSLFFDNHTLNNNAMSQQKRALGGDMPSDGKRVKGEDTPLDKAVEFFDLIEKLKFNSTPNLIARKAIAATAAEEINKEHGFIILHVFEDRYKKLQDQIHQGRFTFKLSNLNGLPISKVGEAYRMIVKSLTVSIVIN